MRWGLIFHHIIKIDNKKNTEIRIYYNSNKKKEKKKNNETLEDLRMRSVYFEVWVCGTSLLTACEDGILSSSKKCVPW